MLVSLISLCADHSRFNLLEWRGDKISGSTYAKSNLMPDLHLRHRLDEGWVEYFIECKYRSTLPGGVLDLTSQLSRYRRMKLNQSTADLFIAVGVGGTPSCPESFYLIPDRMIKRDYIISLKNFSKCLCPKDSDGFHEYISHYFKIRVFNKK